jgi:hypothetical protein
MAHYNRGRIAEYLGMIEEAKEHYQRALGADSTYTPASDALEDLSGE